MPPRVCIQRVPVPWPIRVPVHIRVPYKVTEKVEVKVPVPVKVRDPFPVRVPFPVPYPIQQPAPQKEEKPTTPCPPPIIQPPPTIIHNYVPENEPQIFLRPRSYASKPRPKKEYKTPKYEHYDDPHPEVGFEEMEEGDMRPLSKDEYFIKPGRERRPQFGYPTTGFPPSSTSLMGISPGIFGPRLPFGMTTPMMGMLDPSCLIPGGIAGMGIAGTPMAGYGGSLPIMPQIPPTSSNIHFPTGIQSYLPSSVLAFGGRQPLPQIMTAMQPTQQPNGKDCVKICH